jgi:hypothetical protein
LVLIILILLTYSAISVLIICQLAKYLGKIENSTFKNVLIISIIATIFILGIKYVLIAMSNWANISYQFKMAGNFIIITLVYTTLSKLIWKSSLNQSFISTIIWSITSTVLLYFLLINFNSYQLIPTQPLESTPYWFDFAYW